MDKEQLVSMDPYMLLSIINMKLRDQFSSLDNFCDDMDIEESIISKKLGEVGYSYNESKNQFIAE